jgi:hypothetical protein
LFWKLKDVSMGHTHVNTLKEEPPLVLFQECVGESILSKKIGDGPNECTTDKKCQQPTDWVQKVNYANTVGCVPQNRSRALRRQ